MTSVATLQALEDAIGTGTIDVGLIDLQMVGHRANAIGARLIAGWLAIVDGRQPRLADQRDACGGRRSRSGRRSSQPKSRRRSRHCSPCPGAVILQPRVDGAAPDQLLRLAPVLDAAGVGHRFRNGRGVGPVDLCIAPGERTALMGANSAGKTTLLRILATSTRPRWGIVRWCGTARPRDGRRWIGFAPDAVLDDPNSRDAKRRTSGPAMDARETGRSGRDALHRFGLAAVADEPMAGYRSGCAGGSRSRKRWRTSRVSRSSMNPLPVWMPKASVPWARSS